MEAKTCFKCGVQQPMSEFYRHSRMADGHLNKCKSCTKKDARLNHADKKDYYKNYDKIRSKTEHRKKHMTEQCKHVRIENPARYKAYTAVSNAIRDGRLVKMPCTWCGSTERLHAHHEDYEKPLQVVWMCMEHHKLYHKIKGDNMYHDDGIPS